jgi:ATP-binding cassette subfamily B protein RaxB
MKWPPLNLRLLARRRVQAILQTEVAECGLACLAMVANYWGHHCDLSELRRRFSISLKGITLRNLMSMAERLQLRARPVKVPLEMLPQLKCPAILHWDMNHFVVLQRCDSSAAEIVDPAVGRRSLPLESLAKHFTGVALELTPGSDFNARVSQPSFTLSSLMGQVVGLRGGLARLFAFSVCLQALGLMAPFYLQWVVDEALVTGEQMLVTMLGLGALLLVSVQALVGASRSWFTTALATNLNFQWLGNVFSHLLKLPFDWFEKRHLGDVVSRFGAVQILQRTLTTQFVEACMDGLLVIVTFSLMLAFSLKLAVIALGAVAMYVLVRTALMRPLRSATAEQIVHAAATQSHFIESVRGVQSIRLHNCAAERHAGWLSRLASQFNAELRIARFNLGFQTGNQLLFGLERVVVIWCAALAVLDGQLTVGMLFAFLSYKDQFSQRVAALVDKICEWRMLRLQGERLADIVLQAPEQDRSEGEFDLSANWGDIEFRDVEFRYADGEPPVLHGLNLRIPAGQSLAITGASGCGKTTLVKLLMGLHAPTSGEILVGGRRMQQVGLANYRAIVGSVLQDDQLFVGSVLENICFFDPFADIRKAMACAQLAAVHDEIVSMPMGYNTLVGENGGGLSGGQRQRLLLARAFYRQPRMLVLDEATSHLDVTNERRVNAAIRQLALTRVMVAHRPETIAMADRVVTLDQGRVVRDLLHPVNENKQPEPHHVDKVPIPSHCLESEMPLRREMAAHGA